MKKKHETSKRPVEQNDLEFQNREQVKTVVQEESQDVENVSNTGSTRYEYVYTIVKKDGKDVIIYLHELLMPPPEGYETYHINGNTLDNRGSNLAIKKIKEDQQ